MEKIEFLVFDKLNLGEYKLCKTNDKDLISDIEKEIGREGGYSTNTSSWMNRFPCLENGSKKYVIVPYNIPSYNDIVKATMGKYAILLFDNKEFASFEEEDIKYFQDNILNEFDENRRKQKEEETNEQYARLQIVEYFRLPMLLCSDDTIEIIRFMILNDMKAPFQDLVLGGVMKDEDTVTKVFNKVKFESGLNNISISCDDFITEITLVFFRPEAFFKSIGLSLRECISLYYFLCEEGSWLKERFLGISEKEVRESYKKLLISGKIDL